MRICRALLSLLVLTMPGFAVYGQSGTISGFTRDKERGERLPYTIISWNHTRHWISDSNGNFEIIGLQPGVYRLTFQASGYEETQVETQVHPNGTTRLKVDLKPDAAMIDEIVVRKKALEKFGIDRFTGVNGTTIFEGKKNEIIVLKNTDANLATNCSRQIYAKVPGLNIIENDGAGIQIGIAVRGLNPNRISEFNSRQNGYDISADALGYPESYYTPPTEAIERIEVVRGAASLQYGSQFGGLLNFVMKTGTDSKKVSVSTQQTVGSYGLFNSFNSIGGKNGKMRYYGFLHYKRGNGWRDNSGFHISTGYGSAQYQASKKLTLGAELTAMTYKMQQAGGLTDAQFEQNPRMSTRSRNWFTATWLIPAVTGNYKIADSTGIDVRVFSLIANRMSLGNLISPNQPDYKINRTLIRDDYRNIGAEARFIHSYPMLKRQATLLTGIRFYRGNTHRRQGLGPDGNEADFHFLNPGNLEGSDFRFPSINAAAFAEHIFPLTKRLTVTPGLRYEYILTRSDGYFQNDFQKIQDDRSSARNFPLFGIGLSYHTGKSSDIYFNASQAFSGVNFNDIRVVNPSLRVDPNLKDVTGYNVDFGFRGKYKNVFSFDIGGFYLSYNDRIGTLTKADSNFNIYRYRTNISDSRSLGFEGFTELDVFRLLGVRRFGMLSIYNSIARVDARYINTPVKSVLNKKVEYAPEWVIRSGITYRKGGFSATMQQSYTAEQYTDATNTEFTINAVNGLIPAYQVFDFTVSYWIRKIQLSGSVNNFLNTMYFTRRADGYPGPGILPADGRSFYLSVGGKF